MVGVGSVWGWGMGGIGGVPMYIHYICMYVHMFL